MLPTIETIMKGFQSTMEKQVIPDLSSPYPIFLTRIMTALSDHLVLRSKYEVTSLVDSNDDMLASIEQILGQLDEYAPAKGTVMDFRTALQGRQKRDSYCSISSLQEENFGLRGLQSDLLNALYCLDIPEEKKASLKKEIASSAYRVLKRDYKMVETLVEFQKTLYNMD